MRPARRTRNAKLPSFKVFLFSPLKLSRGRCAETRLGAQIFEPIWHAYLHGPKTLKHPCAKFQSQDVSGGFLRRQPNISWFITRSHILDTKASSGTCQSARGPRKGGKPSALPPMGCVVCSLFLSVAALCMDLAICMFTFRFKQNSCLGLLDGVHQHSPAMDRRDSAWPC